MVQAVFNGTLSPRSHDVSFTPFADTVIGPPRFTLVGSSNSVRGNITLPEADRHSKIEDIQIFYGFDFRVSWKNKNGDERAAVEFSKTQNRSFTLSNLDSGVEYCVQVEIDCNINKNTKASDWICATTSRHEEMRLGPVVIGAVAVPVIVVVISMFCLHYSGFLCKVKAVLPRDLITVLSHGYVLTPERTFPDQLSICSEMGKNRKRNPATLSPATRETNSEEEDDEDEAEDEDEGHVYLDRVGELSPDEMSRQGSGNTSGNSEMAPSRSDGSFREKLSAKLKTLYVEPPQDEVKAEKAEVSLTHKGDKAGVQRQVTDEVKEIEEEEEEEEEMTTTTTTTMNVSGDVNLFSVILGALATCEEEEQEEEEEEESEQNTDDSLPDLLTLSSQEHELAPDWSSDSSHTDSQTELYNNQTGGLIQPAHKGYYGLR
ncbi:uncharacterized protein LOC125017455 isoform X2 [Mugil cephalus]|nr:uncharacterized protein LOC125017455 isoform X2 [Mugil cephalus]XP_047456633.1 uncharacterized protein LOC125017455 isoform X2 [Mugil cephalus]